jgi:hypothetical protein
MSDSIVRDTIAAGLAALTTQTATPQAPFGYGSDISVAGDVDPALAMVDPFSTLGIGQAIVRRWDCARGALPPDGKDAQDYGIDLRGYCNAGITERDMRSLKRRLEDEALKDDRIQAIDAIVSATMSGARVTLSVSATVTPVDARLGTFSLILAATSADVVIIAIGGATQ